MDKKSKEQLLKTLGDEFGIKRILFALPQQEVNPNLNRSKTQLTA